jgi:hypothetical protein
MLPLEGVGKVGHPISSADRLGPGLRNRLSGSHTHEPEGEAKAGHSNGTTYTGYFLGRVDTRHASPACQVRTRDNRIVAGTRSRGADSRIFSASPATICLIITRAAALGND